MPIRKIIVKDMAGTPLGSLTLRLCASPSVSLPKELRPFRYEKAGLVRPYEGTFPTIGKEESFSLLGEWKGTLVFATTAMGQDAAYRKWLLTGSEDRERPDPSSEERAQPPCEASIPAQDAEEESSPPADRAIPLEERFDVVELQAPAEADPLARARARIEAGTPFPLFSELMPGSRWTISEDGAILGITAEDAPRILCGVPGSLDEPPEESDAPMTFFPTDESGERGYYLTEWKESKR